MESESAEHGIPHGKQLLTLSVGALGVVFGDIGTSPLYSVRECLHGEHGIGVFPDTVLGVLSLIFWALTLIISIKYVWYILRADNQGEGGILALMALVTNVPGLKKRTMKLVVMLGLFGAALLFGDGVITPAISVLSAVEGLEVATPKFAPYVVPLSILILIALFRVQKRGTGDVGAIFGPVMALWFLAIGTIGIGQIIHNPSVLAAMNPVHAISFLVRHGERGFLVLGSVFLAVTGGEALYADMGHFGARPMRVSWFGVALPALLLNYFGQGALLLHDPATVENPFFEWRPRGAFTRSWSSRRSQRSSRPRRSSPALSRWLVKRSCSVICLASASSTPPISTSDRSTFRPSIGCSC